MNNPWLGLSSYTEESIKEYQFNGRSVAIASLATMIRQNLFVTLYGRSGIGKTSLLQAGVFPLLRREGFIPITIRLNNISDNDNDSPGAQIIWESLSETLRHDGFIFHPCDENDTYLPDFSDTLVLRKLFSTGKFLDKNDNEAIPVVALDQFEEILYKAPKASRLLISQLYALIDDNCNLIVAHPNWHDDTNFRFVVSLREDDLFLFEDVIDSLNCIDFKSNRYRLLPLSETEAKEIVLKPVSGKHIFEEGNEETIADEIIKLSKGSGQNVNTLMLSLTCYMLYNKCAGNDKGITMSNLEDYGNIIEKYYKTLTKDLPKEQRYFLEDHLIDDQGRRTPIFLSDLEKYAPKGKQLIGNSNKQLLVENQGRVELIHDQLADSILKIRNTRKGKKYKQLGVISLVIVLIGLFLFSYSRFGDVSAPTSHYRLAYKNKSVLVNNTEDTLVTIPDCNTYEINDCPSLKSIKIEGQGTSIKVYNCPNLVNISYPDNYNGCIFIFHCPNIYFKDPKIQVLGIDSTNFKTHINYMSQFPCDGESYLYDEKIYDATYKYDSISNTLIVKVPPVNIYSYNQKIPTCIPDSIKNNTDCYVPFGYKNQFSQLEEFKPFHSIRELPVYYTWKSHTIGMFGFLKTEKKWLRLTIIGILLVQYFFCNVGFVIYEAKYKNSLTVLFLSTIYGIGMSLLAILSFMAFYWTTYNIILPFNQPVSAIIGFIGCLLCMVLVYKNAFYAVIRYFRKKGINGLITDVKSYGIHGFVRDIQEKWVQLKTKIKSLKTKIKSSFTNSVKTLHIFSKCIRKNAVPYIRKNAKSIILILAVVVPIGTMLIFYIDGKNKRSIYIDKLYELIRAGQNVRAFAIIKELDKQHKSLLYPTFAHRLDDLRISFDDSIRIAHRITPTDINKIAEKQGNPLNFESFDKLLAVANDASKFAISVEYPKSNDLQEDKHQAILVDLNIPSIIPLTEQTDRLFPHYSASFSPSGNSLIIEYDGHRYSYSDINKSVVDIGRYCDTYDSRDILMYNDSVYYFTSYGNLYKGYNRTDTEPQKMNNSGIYDNLIKLPNGLIGSTGNWHEIIIYNPFVDSVYFQSKTRFVGDLRNINQEYAITTKGLYDIKRDSLIYKNNQLYKYIGNIVELQKHNDQYSFFDLEGNKVVDIITRDSERLNEISFSQNGNSIIDFHSDGISIYSIIPIAGREWVISEDDKKFFNLK